eukprot:1956321-Rhodomonas_salina.2
MRPNKAAPRTGRRPTPASTNTSTKHTRLRYDHMVSYAEARSAYRQPCSMVVLVQPRRIGNAPNR